MGTMEAVEDLDRIRAAVGDERLTYWGMSYGTRIGYVYAVRHPDRVRATVLDGSIDPTSTVLGLTEGGAAPDQAYGSFADAYPASDRRWATVRRELNRRTVRLAGGEVLDRSVALDFVYGFVAQQSSYALLAQVATRGTRPSSPPDRSRQPAGSSAADSSHSSVNLPTPTPAACSPR